MKFTRAVCWVNSKIATEAKTPDSFCSYFVTTAGHYYGVIVEGL